MLRRYSLYLIRWQMSTPVLAVCIIYFAYLGDFWSTVIANFLGGLIFFWVDRFIFRHCINKPIWEVHHEITCTDCGNISRGYRLVAAHNYDKRQDPKPEFRCEQCSILKAVELQDRGVPVT